MIFIIVYKSPLKKARPNIIRYSGSQRAQELQQRSPIGLAQVHKLLFRSCRLSAMPENGLFERPGAAVMQEIGTASICLRQHAQAPERGCSPFIPRCKEIGPAIGQC